MLIKSFVTEIKNLEQIMKGLIRRKSNKPKTINIGGNDYYSSSTAAEVLGFSKRKLTAGLKSGRFPFAFATLEDTPNSMIYVSVRDVEVYIRRRDLDFQERLRINTR